MRSKPFLTVIWVAATLAAIIVVWQSLGFVSTRTEDDAADRALTDLASGAVATAPPAAVAATSTTVGGEAPTSTAPTSTAPTSTAPTSTAPTSTTTTGSAAPPADAVDQAFELIGGTAVVRFSATGVVVLSAVPANGFQASIEPEGSGMKVEFRSDEHRSRVDVWWDNGPQSSWRERAD